MRKEDFVAVHRIVIHFFITCEWPLRGLVLLRIFRTETSGGVGKMGVGELYTCLLSGDVNAARERASGGSKTDGL